MLLCVYIFWLHAWKWSDWALVRACVQFCWLSWFPSSSPSFSFLLLFYAFLGGGGGNEVSLLILSCQPPVCWDYRDAAPWLAAGPAACKDSSFLQVSLLEMLVLSVGTTDEHRWWWLTALLSLLGLWSGTGWMISMGSQGGGFAAHFSIVLPCSFTKVLKMLWVWALARSRLMVFSLIPSRMYLRTISQLTTLWITKIFPVLFSGKTVPAFYPQLPAIGKFAPQCHVHTH